MPASSDTRTQTEFAFTLVRMADRVKAAVSEPFFCGKTRERGPAGCAARSGFRASGDVWPGAGIAGGGDCFFVALVIAMRAEHG